MSLILTSCFLVFQIFGPGAFAAVESISASATAEDKIMVDPVGEYAMYSARLRKDGANASFPEFKPVIDKLRADLSADHARTVIAAHPALALELNEVLAQLTHVNLDFTFDHAESYPYPRPFPGIYPYRPTIDAIESALRLFDKIDRLSDSKAVPLYHFDRYAYHRHSLLADPEVVIFPTLRPLSFEDLIRTRAVPIGFAGVVTRTTRVDRHFQSPLDFWYHDLNHVRRMVAYTALKATEAGAKSVSQRLKVYRGMNQLVADKIIPNIVKLPAGSPAEDVAVRHLVRVILFEILHETALAADRDSILEDLLRAPNTPQPFEHMRRDRGALNAAQTEGLRTATGNLESGASVLRARDAAGAGDPVVIRYFHDRALGLLANVYNKINFGFFDDVLDPRLYVAKVEYRKAEFLVKAAQNIFAFLDYAHPPGAATLRDMVLSKEGNPEKFVYQRLQPHEADVNRSGPQATEPIGADDIIAQVRAIGKTVHTLFGYSRLGYQREEDVMDLVRLELAKLDPKTTVICIGATEEGIGAAYAVAKDMGFETIGIVSTQALTYSGKFSPFVDRIYIVNDGHWGGYVPGSDRLTPATRAFLGVSDVISAYGGGENTAVTLTEAWKLGKLVRFTPAEMNHAVARKDAAATGTPLPDLRGAATARCEHLFLQGS